MEGELGRKEYILNAFLQYAKKETKMGVLFSLLLWWRLWLEQVPPTRGCGEAISNRC